MNKLKMFTGSVHSSRMVFARRFLMMWKREPLVSAGKPRRKPPWKLTRNCKDSDSANPIQGNVHVVEDNSLNIRRPTDSGDGFGPVWEISLESRDSNAA